MAIWGERISPCFQTGGSRKSPFEFKKKEKNPVGGYKNVMFGGKRGVTRFEKVEDLGKVRILLIP
jgi:hypothetical protein